MTTNTQGEPKGSWIDVEPCRAGRGWGDKRGKGGAGWRAGRRAGWRAGLQIPGGQSLIFPLPSHRQCLAHSKCSLNMHGISSFNLQLFMLYDKTDRMNIWNKSQTMALTPGQNPVTPYDTENENPRAHSGPISSRIQVLGSPHAFPSRRTHFLTASLPPPPPQASPAPGPLSSTLSRSPFYLYISQTCIFY